jgi:hypothetical protein
VIAGNFASIFELSLQFITPSLVEWISTHVSFGSSVFFLLLSLAICFAAQRKAMSFMLRLLPVAECLRPVRLVAHF